MTDTFSADGKLLALGGRGGFAVWDVEARKIRFCVEAQSEIGAVAFSPDGKLLAAGGGYYERADDAAVRLWDVSTGKEVGKLEGHDRHILSVAFAPDGKTLASSSFDGTIRIWDVAKKATIRRMDCKGDQIAFSPDGKKLAVAERAYIRFFDPASGELLLEITNTGGWLESLSFSPDGKTLAVAGGSSAIQLWDTTTGKEVLPHDGHLDAVGDVVFSADGKTLASRGGDRTVRLWDLAALKQKRVLSIGPGRFFGHEEDFIRSTRCLAFTPDGKKVACTGGHWGFGDPPNGCLWDTATGELTKFAEIHHPPYALAVSPDGETMATYSFFGLHLRSLTSGKEIGPISGLGTTLTFLPDGRILVLCYDHAIRLVDCKTCNVVGTISTGESSFSSIAASPDGALLATCGPMGLTPEWSPVYVWETASGKLLCKLGDKTHGARCASFACDGRRLVAATKKSVNVWDVLTGDELSAPDGKPLLTGGHLGDVLCAAVSPDGKTIASGSADTTILLWNAADLLPKTPAADPGPKDLDRLWDDLRSDDAPTAYKAILALLGAPDKATAVVRDRLPPTAKPDPKKVKDFLAALDGNDVDQRDAASRELGRLGEAVEPALHETLAATPSAEVRRRCEELLEALRKGEADADGLRGLRAVQVLEHAGTPEARAVLKGLAGGAPGRLSRAAKLGLDLLDRR